ncbi:hypothetical protein OBBRIDRAFT_794242 [Obba rivulosa]|uniref:Uncharacterized protein n=1 Tax=Obba rivulosa TaxID=1052685 RepID=A0A8E2AR82_9APHY|nr:hypothetical protein OBBRIDRAFT_794242 [Obba rivulosa]
MAPPPPRTYFDFVLDVSDVLFDWPAELPSSIPRKVWRQIFWSKTWFDFERGRIDQAECYRSLAEEFKMPAEHILEEWGKVREVLHPNAPLLAAVRELKEQSEGKMRVYGAFNVTAPDYEYFRAKAGADWSLFDQVYASTTVRERMPNPSFYKAIYSDAGINPHTSVFLSHDLDNVVTPRAYGMHGVQLSLKDPKPAIRALRNLAGDPVQRGWEYMRNNAGKHVFETDTGVVMIENFGQLLILEATGDRSLVSFTEPPRWWNFFQGEGVLTYNAFLPDDNDTTCMGLSVLKPPEERVQSMMDDMLENRSDDGLPWTYVDRTMPRLDPSVCCNVLHLFYSHGRGHQLPEALDFVANSLDNRAYIEGTRYYVPDCFLWFVYRLLQATSDAGVHARLKELLRVRTMERVGSPGDPLAYAQRILVLSYFGIADEVDLRLLRALQCEDGGWEIGWIYKYGISGMLIGGRGWATAMAINAIEAFEKL